MLRPATRTASILVTTLLIAACSGSGSGTTAPSASSAPSAAASSAAPSSAAPSASAGGSASASSDSYEIKTATNAAITGSFLTGEDGKTLYVFKKDTQGSGKSTCNAGCADKWPAFTLDGSEQATAGDGVTASKISMITRDDGTKQVAYDGWPLYYFASDSAAGDVNGQGVGEVWFVATP